MLLGGGGSFSAGGPGKGMYSRLCKSSWNIQSVLRLCLKLWTKNDNQCLMYSFCAHFLYWHNCSATKHIRALSQKLCSFLLIITLTFLVLWYADLNVLNQYPQFHSISAFNNIYNDTGIFGIQVTTVSPFKYCPLWNHDFLDIFKDLSIMK